VLCFACGGCWRVRGILRVPHRRILDLGAALWSWVVGDDGGRSSAFGPEVVELTPPNMINDASRDIGQGCGLETMMVVVERKFFDEFDSYSYTSDCMGWEKFYFCAKNDHDVSQKL
jgi:hypothetical protein